ncbi:MAG: hypothetical protein QXD05_00245 [Candidatus Pacearchaeota archaeon]
MNKSGIFINPKHKGLFTKKAKRHGMSVQEFADYVLDNPSKFDAKTRLQARFAKNAKKFKH